MQGIGQHPNALSPGNGWLDILGPEGGADSCRDNKPAVAARLWLLDSMDRGCGLHHQSWCVTDLRV